MFVEPIVNKKTHTVLEAFKKIHKRMTSKGKKIQSICSDLGSEFVNSEFKKYLQDFGILLKHSKRLNHCSIVERSNRTIQGLIGRFCTENQSPRFIDHLDKIVYTYNNRVHRMIKMTPSEAELPSNQDKLVELFLKRLGKIKKKKAKFGVGQMVRITKNDYKFRRSYMKQIQDEVFFVHSIDESRKIPLYELRELDSDIVLDGKWMNFELVATNNRSLFSFRKVMKRRNRGAESLIAFNGLPDDFNQWINTDELNRIIQNGNKPLFRPLLKYVNE